MAHWLGEDVVGRIHKDGKLVGVTLRSGETVSVRGSIDLPGSTESSKDSPRRYAETHLSRKTDMTEKATRSLKPFNMPKGKEQKIPTEGSKRRVAYDLIARPEGATLEQVQEGTGWTRRNAVEGVRLLSKHNGYGLVQDAAGAIRLA